MESWSHYSGKMTEILRTKDESNKRATFGVEYSVANDIKTFDSTPGSKNELQAIAGVHPTILSILSINRYR